MKRPTPPAAPLPLNTSTSTSASSKRKQPRASLSIQPPPPSSSLNPNPPTNTPSSPRLLTSSFFTPINPHLPLRLATTPLYPQNIFPTPFNPLPHTLHQPYAFSHHTLSFHWTRSDALLDLTWNIYSQPPCLNCVLACSGDPDGDLARHCDLARLRERSQGRIEECSRCARMRGRGQPGGKSGVRFGPLPGGSCCVQQVEVRGDGGLMAREGEGRMGMWGPSEGRLRRRGVVEWRAINLHVGDVEGKAGVVAEWGRMRDWREIQGRGWEGNWVLPTKGPLEKTEDPRKVRRVWEEGVMDFESEEEKKERVKRAVARVAEWDREDVLLGIATEDEDSEDELEKARTDIESMFKHIPELEMEIARQKSFWKLRIQAARVHQHDAELDRQDPKAAMKLEAGWLEEGGVVLREVEDWLDQVLRGKAERASSEELSRLEGEKLSARTRVWMRDLVPRIWDMVGIDEAMSYPVDGGCDLLL